MTTGELLYLLMCLGTFSSFAIALAYASWQQGQMGPEMITSGVARDDHGGDEHHGHAVHA